MDYDKIMEPEDLPRHNADFHLNVIIQAKTAMRKWTLAQGGGIGAKDVSTLQ